VSEPSIENTPPPAPRKTVWQRRVADPIVQQLTQGITPEKIALTLAVGTACACFPILGTTTLLCLFVGIFLRLNQPLIQLVNALCTLPHLLVIYALFRLGSLIFGVPISHSGVGEFIFRAPHTRFNIWIILGAFSKAHRPFLHRMEMSALHSIVAWLIVAPAWIAAVYWSTLPFLRRTLRTRVVAVVEVVPVSKPPVHPVP
jgi:uncharacterized protein (DUF2062 family)